MNTNEPHKRFSSRVEQYARYRPDYPADIPSLLVNELSLPKGPLTIADIGSGTGLLSEVFLNGFSQDGSVKLRYRTLLIYGFLD
jgi:tRNA1(Val) A37 N6-methylase TrmN6